MKRLLFFFLLCLALTACGAESSNKTELIVFAASSLTEALDTIIEDYQATVPHVTIIATYDSSGALKTQIQEGALCNLFISASPKQMDILEKDGMLEQNTRIDLLENKVTLSVPEGNPAGIESFDQLANLLKNGDVMLAIGNSDVPVGQYTQKIFTYYEIDEHAVADKLTYGSNVKEVTTQVSEAAVDCGIIYGTDAYSANLTVVDTATAEMCGQVIYPAAVINSDDQVEAAHAFLDYLHTDEAMACFQAVGFSPLA